MTVFEKIEAQQKGKEGTAVWMVGEQVKDICRREPSCASIVAEDLENEAMSLAACEKQIKARADKTPRKGNCVCIPPNVAEEIIRDFYGLPAAGAVPQTAEPVPEEKPVSGHLDLDAFL